LNGAGKAGLSRHLPATLYKKGGSMQKRREHPRLKFGVVVKDKRSKKQGTTRNISIDGCFIKKEGDFNELLPIGTPIDLVLTLPNTDKKITVAGVVRHHGTQEDGIGISFEEIDDHSVAIIQEFIKTFLDDLSGDNLAGIKEEYWKEVDQLKGKTPHDT
jgi:Tfp pilus assembly protein PilZ